MCVIVVLSPWFFLPVEQNQGFYPGMYGPVPQQSVQPPTETCQISVPNSAVGAIIGAGGSNIKQIIRDSNAFVTVSKMVLACNLLYKNCM